MCGIAGFVDKGKYIDVEKREHIVMEMLRLMKHRGGDAHGVKSKNNVSIGHIRLSILDLSSSGNQPFSDSTQNQTLSFNGEIFNHYKLKKEYLGNTEINSSSDTTTLFEMLREFSVESVLEKIHGMFAFSFLDVESTSIFLALDRFAVKPLYYIDTPEYFVWASEIKAFSALPKHKFQLNDRGIGEHLVFRYISGSETLFENIHKLQAGEYLTYNLSSNLIKIQKYYKLQKQDYKKGFSEKVLASSVKEHLMGDVAAGVQLSGGLDSSLVALFAQKFSKERLHTFSIGLEDEKWNEFYYSDLVAKQLNTKHHKLIFSKQDFARLLPKVIYYLDEPLVHPNTVPMYILAKEARKHTKVLLTGEGADEVFYGYSRYFQTPSEDIIFLNSFNKPTDILEVFKGGIHVTNRKKIIQGLNDFTEEDAKSFYDIYTYLPHVLLRQDKAGMAANIENRVPFLYTPIAEAGFNSDTKIGKFGGKTQLKEIALKYFPRDFVHREKCGFGLPISNWLRDEEALLPYVSDLAESKIIKNCFRIDIVEQLIREHLNEKKNNSSILFTLICLSIWHEIFVE